MTPEQQAMIDKLAFKVMKNINDCREDNLDAIRAWYVGTLPGTDPAQAADVEGNADRMIAALRARLAILEAPGGGANA